MSIHAPPHWGLVRIFRTQKTRKIFWNEQPFVGLCEYILKSLLSATNKCWLWCSTFAPRRKKLSQLLQLFLLALTGRRRHKQKAITVEMTVIYTALAQLLRPISGSRKLKYCSSSFWTSVSWSALCEPLTSGRQTYLTTILGAWGVIALYALHVAWYCKSIKRNLP